MINEYSVLREIGLTDIEVKTYLALISLGSVQAGKLIGETKLHKASVYLALSNLNKKGLVGYITKSKTRIWTATEPEILLQKEKETLEKLNQILPNLRPIKRKVINANVLEGEEGFKTVFRDAIKAGEYYHLVVGVKVADFLGNFFHQLETMKKKMKVKSKLLLSESSKRDKNRIKVIKEIYGEIRYLPETYEAPISTIIYGYKIALIIWPEKISFILESQDIAKAYKTYFETLWKIAKE